MRLWRNSCACRASRALPAARDLGPSATIERCQRLTLSAPRKQSPMNPASPHPVTPLQGLLWPPPSPASVDLLRTPGLELSFNARGALWTAFREIRATGGTHVLLPAFHCPSAVTPALMAGLQPVYYRIGRDLAPDVPDMLRLTDARTAAVLVIRFFGLPLDLAALAPLRQRGVRIVEDCSHSFAVDDPLRLAGDPDSDYRVYSFWKIVPSGVGGGLLRRDASPSLRPAAGLTQRLRAYKRLAEEALAGSPHRALARVADGAERFRLALRQSSKRAPPTAPPHLESGESYYPVDPELAAAAMPAFARRILASSDLRQIAQRRRDNFRLLASAMPRLSPLRPLSVTPGDDGCPWVFPVLLDGRDGLDRRLREAGVPLHTFGIYLHSTLFASGTDERTVADARYLAKQLLCLSIHQDLSPEDMERIIDITRAVLALTASA